MYPVTVIATVIEALRPETAVMSADYDQRVKTNSSLLITPVASPGVATRTRSDVLRRCKM